MHRIQLPDGFRRSYVFAHLPPGDTETKEGTRIRAHAVGPQHPHIGRSSGFGGVDQRADEPRKKGAGALPMWCQSVSYPAHRLLHVQEPGKVDAGCVQCRQGEEQVDRTKHEFDLSIDGLEKNDFERRAEIGRWIRRKEGSTDGRIAGPWKYESGTWKGDGGRL